jgi:rhodanese-related sulfurtransferase
MRFLADLPRTALTAAALAAVGCALALGVNAARSANLPLIRPPSDGTSPAAPWAVTLATAKDLYDQGAVFVDSRTAAEYAAGHIRGARLLYYAHAEQECERVMTGEDWNAPVVVYCSGEGCNSSEIVADALRDFGCRQVYVFQGGWPAWVAAGYPTEGAPQEIKLYGIK